MSCEISSIAIIGFGKFGQLLHGILSRALPEKKLVVYTEPCNFEANTEVKFIGFEELNQSDLIIFALPISAFESSVKKLNQVLKSSKIIIDVCSVKVHPKKVMREYLVPTHQVICTHPLFGPASFAANNNIARGLSVTIENISATEKVFLAIKDFLNFIECSVLEIDADEHDRTLGGPQFLTHLAAAIFKPQLAAQNEFPVGIKSLDFFRAGLQLLTADEALLKDLYDYNSYARQTFNEIQDNWQNILKKLK